MKSKYLFTLLLVSVLPVAAVIGVYAWMALNEAPAPSQTRSVNTGALAVTVPAIQTTNQSIASSLKANIERTYVEIPKLMANHTDRDLEDFSKSHPDLSGMAVFTTEGRLLKTIPATAQLMGPDYGTSDEFQKMMAKFKEDGGKTYLTYTHRLSYPAFVFGIPLDSKTVVLAVLNLASFFQGFATKGGEIFLFDAESGQYFYHSNPSKLETSFNPNQEPWLSKVQESVKSGQFGSTISDDSSFDAVYTPVGIKAFGIVHVIPMSNLQGGSSSHAPSHAPSSIEGLPEIFQTPMGMTMLIAGAGALAWVFLVGAVCFGMIVGPLRKASALVLSAAKGGSGLTPEAAKKFGRDEVGQMVQASALLFKKLEDDRRQADEEKEEALKRGRVEVESKSREAASQVSNAQQQANVTRNELAEKNQLLSDKLKELDALKSMSEGLRSQSEQAKAEVGRLKSQVGTAEEAKNSLQSRFNQAQEQIKEMEAKMLTALAASSAIHVSQVRAAAIRTMAEELKTTLGIIKGYVSSALGTPAGGINEKQQEFLGMVINRSARLEKFINDLLDIYQVEIEQTSASYEEVNLASEIEALAFNFQAQAEVKNIKIKVEPKGTLPNVPIVRRRFNQLWNILYLQIIKDAPRGSNIPISLEAIGETVKATVQDPGLTVTAEGLPKLFDEFYDPKHPASPQLAGTGLKFALVKTILAAHGGGAVAEKGDPGTRLVLTFATKVKKPGETPAPAATAAAAKPGLPTPTMGLKPPAPSSFGLPKTPGPGAPAAPGAPKPAGGGLLDSLIAKVPPVTAPGLRPSPIVPPKPGLTPPPPPPPGLTPPPALKPPTAAPATPTPGPSLGIPPAAPKPAAPGGLSAGLLDALLDKKPAPGPAVGPGLPPPAAPKPATPPVTPLGMGAPSVGAPPGLKPPSPAGPIPGMPVPPKPPLPGVPPVGAPPMAPKPPIPVPGMPAPGVPAAPKVVPTAMKPAPAPGVLDLESTDGMKLDAGAPKPSTPAARPPMPGAPPIPGAPKPPSPGVPPGGLDASKTQKGKDGEGDLIE